MKDNSIKPFAFKDEKVQEMVLNKFKTFKEQGQFQSIEQIFGRLPLSRLLKRQYSFLFDTVKNTVQTAFSQKDLLRTLLQSQAQIISKIPLQYYKTYKYDELLQKVFDERLLSGRQSKYSILFLRNHPSKGFFPHEPPFIADKKKLSSPNSREMKMLLQEYNSLHEEKFQLVNENRVQFIDRRFPFRNELDNRADVLAKLYLLEIYKAEGLKIKQIQKLNQQQKNKEKEIKKIQQELKIQKIKDQEMIQEMDLIKQVFKLLTLIQKRMNQQAYNQFISKNGQAAAVIKRSLQKLKKTINQEPSLKQKILTLIKYKHNKGW